MNPFAHTDTHTEVIRRLDLSKVPQGSIRRFWLHLISDGMGLPVYIPVIVARGRKDGPVLGITAAIRGNEINGIPLIQRFFQEVSLDNLAGTVIGVPVINIPSLLIKERNFIDGTDLNRVMPGRADGSNSQVYAFRLVDRIIRYFDYLLDLHTASFGRVNAHYIRADMDDPICREMAILQNAQVIVHNLPSDGSLRGAADSLGIYAITLEVGSPHTFHKGFLRSGLTGIYNLLCQLQMTEGAIELPESRPYICKNSYWIYSDSGGILTVAPNVGELVYAGETIATLRNIFGDVIKEYTAPENGIVIGKSVDPINQTGGRIIHLGVLE
jgi:uncharacterized protein